MIDQAIHQLTDKFINSLSPNLDKGGYGQGIQSDSSLQMILHLISCASKMKVMNESNSSSRNSLSTQLFQPILNGMLALFGKLLMDSFTFEPKVTELNKFTQAYEILGRHILSLFPEMATKKHKSTGKMLIHHAVYKARPVIAEETVKQILKISPESAISIDSTGALPLHWATRNSEVAFEVIDMLVQAYPQGLSVSDNKGFLPLHWAVNQDQPNIEVVKKLLKMYPEGAAVPSQSGNLPLHYCVSREKPNLSVIKALVAVYPESIKTKCEEGFLPLHRYVQRPLIDLEVLKLLIHYFPEGLTHGTFRRQTPLHVALDHHTPDALAIEIMLKEAPEVCEVQDKDGYLPLHLCLDCSFPNYSLADQLLKTFPKAALYQTKEEMLPMHLLVGTNTNPDLHFATALLQRYPEALLKNVQEFVPAIKGEAMADPESWSGEWIEAQWSPLSRAQDRGFKDLVHLFSRFEIQMKHDPNRFKTNPVPFTPQASPQPQGGHGGRGQASQPRRSPGGVLRTSFVRENNEILLDHTVLANQAFSGGGDKQQQVNKPMGIHQQSPPVRIPDSSENQNPIVSNQRQVSPSLKDPSPKVLVRKNGSPEKPEETKIIPFDQDFDGNFPNMDSRIGTASEIDRHAQVVTPGTPSRTSVTYEDKNNNNRNNNLAREQSLGPESSNRTNVGDSPAMKDNFFNDPTPKFNPASKVPEHILRAQIQAQQSIARQSQPITLSSPSNDPDDSPAKSPGKPKSPDVRATTAAAGMRAPPPGPIPASLLQAAENNALRYAKAQADLTKKGGITTKGKSKKPSTATGNTKPNDETQQTPSQMSGDGSGGDASKQQRLLQAQQFKQRQSKNKGNSNALDGGPSVSSQDSGKSGSKVRIHPVASVMAKKGQVVPMNDIDAMV